MLAGVACGLFKDFKQAAERNVKIRNSYQPDLQNKKIYDRLFEVYLHSYENMREDYHRISDF
jgi:xylulokinase